MKKIISIMAVVLVALSLGMTVKAEDTCTKPNVYIDYFWRPSDMSFTWAETLRNCVIDGINETGRVDLTDVDSNSALAVEKARRESGELSDGDDMERLKVMTTEGANYLIQGRVSSIAVTKTTGSSGSVTYTATCAYTLKVINPADGKLVATKTFKHGDGMFNLQSSSTIDEAVAKVCKQAIKAVRELVDEAFPLKGTILEISEAKKDEAKQVYISIGSDHGVSKGAYFSACIQRTVAGRASEKEIGELEAVEVEGGDLTLCKVKKGGKEIKSALDAGQEVILKTKQRPQNLWDKTKTATSTN